MDDIHPIKPVITTPVLTQNQIIGFWVFVGVIFLGLVFLLAVYFYKKYRLSREPVRGGGEEKEEKNIDYRRIAVSRLLEAKNYIDLNKYKEFYLAVTEIIKEYLSAIYEINYIDFTTQEILKDKNLPSDTKRKLAELLRVSDLAKFADQGQKKKKAEEIYDLAYLLLN